MLATEGPITKQAIITEATKSNRLDRDIIAYYIIKKLISIAISNLKWMI